MRLKRDKLSLLESFKNKYKAKFYLFGSRLDETKKGGDIDLLVLNNDNISNLKLSLVLEREFFKKFEEKIDVVVFDKNMTKDQKLFFNSLTKKEIGVN